MTVYSKTNPQYLCLAVESTLRAISFAEGTYSSISLTIGVDGPVRTELIEILQSYNKNPCINVVFFSENRGLGLTLADLVVRSEAEILVRMDDDDIMCEQRIASCLHAHYERKADIVCGNITEFDSENALSKRVRRPAANLQGLSCYLRNPINHVAVSFSRSLALKSGNYQDVRFFEDWDFWLRMKKHRPNYVVLDQTFVNVRFDRSALDRRRGYKYAVCELMFAKSILRNKDVKSCLFLCVLPGRILLRLMPSKILERFMEKYLRD